MIVPILLSGGLGTRLWPSSRKSKPKQFINLVDQKYSLMQGAVNMVSGMEIPHTGWVIVANEEHKFTVAEQLNEISGNVENIILEEIGKGTGPAITLAAFQALKISPNAKLLILTADHKIPDKNYFQSFIKEADSLSLPLMTFGVNPRKAETGFGYIELGERIELTNAFRVHRFIEKPPLAQAEDFINNGNFLWNSGMFLLEAKTFLNEMLRFAPDIYRVCGAAIEEANKIEKFLSISGKALDECPTISIDHCIMEKSNLLSVLPFKSDWSDLGSWTSVYEELQHDQYENAISGNGIAYKAKRNLIRSENRLVAALGVNDLLIAETADAILVSSKEHAGQLNQILRLIKSSGGKEAEEHTIGYRPWGTYEIVVKGKYFQVKKIIVNPGKSLSLQSHNYRAEHWVVVEGVADIINGEQELKLTQNQSTYIPIGAKHRLSNFGEDELIIIEVQTGTYLGEDDIIRFEDVFGRA